MKPDINKQFEILGHPADVKVRAYGKNMEELFANAALGMMHVLYGENLKTCKPGKTESVQLTSNDQEALLVDWLSDLLFLTDTNDNAYSNYSFQKLTETELQAEIASCAAQAIDDIKAVTYHGLKIEKENGFLQATILFDI